LWNERFNELKDYKEEYGRTNVPRSENKQLCEWVKTQRKQYGKFQENRKGKITLERIQTLESIGFEWVLNRGGPRNESQWNKHFNELKEYKEEYGHTNVSQSNKQLGLWVKKQRTEYKKFKKNGKSQITSERIELLESIDFEWVSQNKVGQTNESAWNKRFNELKAYKEKYGRTNVPNKYEENKELGRWVSNQRTEYKKFKKNGKAKITKERIEMLNSIDFEWVAQNDESLWNRRFTELKDYKEKFGDTKVPYDFKDNIQLGQWVSTQRYQCKIYKKNGKAFITPERIQMLNSIGFQWECRPGRAPRS